MVNGSNCSFFQTFVGDIPFTRCFKLGYDASFDCWEWAKHMIVDFTLSRKLKSECPDCKPNSRGASIMYLLWFFFHFILLLINEHMLSLPQTRIWMKCYAYSIFILTLYIFPCKKIHKESKWGPIKSNRRSPTFVGSYIRICAPWGKQKLLVCNALTI